MTKAKRSKTKWPGIYSYEIATGMRYEVRCNFSDKKGRTSERCKSGLKTLAEAKAKKREFEELISHSRGSQLNKLTLDEWFERFLKVKDYSPKSGSLTNTMWTYENILAPKFGHHLLHEIDRETYQVFINGLSKRYRAASVIGFNETMMRILNEAERCEVITSNKLRGTKVKKDETKKKKHLEIDEYLTFMNKAKDYLEPHQFCMILLCSWGLRRGEMLALSEQSITFLADGRAHLDIAKSRTKSSPEGKAPKTENSVRSIVVDGTVVDYLRKALKHIKLTKLKNGKSYKKDDFLFVNDFGEPYAISSANRHLEVVSSLCGIKASPHMLRHTFITHSRLNGAPSADLSKFVGHKNINTLDIYSHATNEGTEKVVSTATKVLQQF